MVGARDEVAALGVQSGALLEVERAVGETQHAVVVASDQKVVGQMVQDVGGVRVQRVCFADKLRYQRVKLTALWPSRV